MHRYIPPIVLLLCLPLVAFAQTSPLRVIATTTIIADIAAQVGGDRVEITALVPPDADTHSFSPTPRDMAQVSEAQVILVNGASLEQTLLDVIENAAVVELTVVSQGVEMLAFGDADEHETEDHDDHAHENKDADTELEHEIPATIGQLGINAECGIETEHEEHAEDELEDDEAEHDHGMCDPHVWGNPQNIIIWADNIAAAFAAADPENAEIYQNNAAAYKTELAALDAELETLLNAIPEANRVLVTNHEFLGYFAARYDFEIVGNIIPGGSTLAEPAPQALADLIDTIQAAAVPAIFAEVSDTNALASMIANDLAGVAVVTLYSESLGTPDGPAATYLDYMRYNANVIVDALEA